MKEAHRSLEVQRYWEYLRWYLTIMLLVILAMSVNRESGASDTNNAESQMPNWCSSFIIPDVTDETSIAQRVQPAIYLAPGEKVPANEIAELFQVSPLGEDGRIYVNFGLFFPEDTGIETIFGTFDAHLGDIEGFQIILLQEEPGVFRVEKVTINPHGNPQSRDLMDPDLATCAGQLFLAKGKHAPGFSVDECERGTVFELPLQDCGYGEPLYFMLRPSLNVGGVDEGQRDPLRIDPQL